VCYACPALQPVDLKAKSYKDWPVGRKIPTLVSMQLDINTTTVLDVKGLGPRQALGALR